jgi:hypothetical protein
MFVNICTFLPFSVDTYIIQISNMYECVSSMFEFRNLSVAVSTMYLKVYFTVLGIAWWAGESCEILSVIMVHNQTNKIYLIVCMLQKIFSDM